MNMEDLELAEAIRSFNRFYTEAIGSLAEDHEGLAVTLGQSRVLYTINSLESPQVNDVAEALDLDLAYTSRLLGALEDAKLIRRTIAPDDRRQRVVTATAKGLRLLGEIEDRSNRRVLRLVDHLDDDERAQLLDHLDHVRQLLTTTEASDA